MQAGKPAEPSTARTVIWLIGGLAFVAALAIGLGSPTLLAFMLIGFAPTIAKTEAAAASGAKK